jgi:hypothetical protein
MIPDSVARLRKRRKADSGKFKRSRRLGVSMEGDGEHHGWRFEVSRSRVGVTVRRDVFSLTIRDEEGSMLHRLSGFTKREQAVVAARSWIDEAQALMDIRVDREHRQKGMRALKRVARKNAGRDGRD